METFYRFKEFWNHQGAEYKHITILNENGDTHAAYTTFRSANTDAHGRTWAPLTTYVKPQSELLGTWHSDASTRDFENLPPALSPTRQRCERRLDEAKSVGDSYRVHIARMTVTPIGHLAIKPIPVRFDASIISPQDRRRVLREIMQASPDLVLDWLLIPTAKPSEILIEQSTQGENR